ncbi:hypothetical protein KCV87_07960 [Actinosynnema pretiosum subsp. pretiosum]|uniref:Uncharacterized protein n=1 Tax=Actinosynnema pretiosum subsp. pretiosum TaxID=103721 RepID=A0AA45R5S3_9PSEU|nr:hypothetical protein [Actinosynnema mirum]QUF05988.1 hypothetical protein KCV87_07960 [Actinosynnema pretiosum subsp. pretiosum]
MAVAEPLSADEQQDVLDDITTMVLPTLPRGWVQLVVRASVIGRHSEASAGVLMPDRTTVRWDFPPDVWELFQLLRKGMHVEGLGSWVGFSYVLDPPHEWSISYNRDEAPVFQVAPTGLDYATENRWFPRDPETAPAWFRVGLARARG